MSFLPFGSRYGNTFGRDDQTEFGETPLSSAAARMNGLIADPGWRLPLVARLNGRFSKLSPPTIARTAPVLFSITTIDAVGPTPVSRPAIAWWAACWSAGSSDVLILSPLPKVAPGP
jgi:hypothetical protein